MMINKKVLIVAILLLVSAFVIDSVSAASLNATVCCEKTKSNLFCQDIPTEECATGSRQVPSACDSTSYCKAGTCYNSKEGTCLDNTPEIICNANGGVWSAETPAQCQLGCCVLGDQAAFVTLTRCKYLASKLGIKTDYDKSIKDENSCVLKVSNQDKGACVYDFEFDRTCKFTTREQCNLGLNGSNTAGEFFKDKLCSAPELGTNCGQSTKTTCLAGKDEVYFQDTCGNPANIYDANKINDADYWTNVKTKSESCSSTSANANSASCGNCNYLLGSYCRASSSTKINPSVGNYICGDLNCKKTQNGQSYKHGESWCVYGDKGATSTDGDNSNAVGSQFFKHICINGEEVVEACADYRNQECVENKIQISTGGEFSQAACRVNRYQDCLQQTSQLDCENTDKRDCTWQSNWIFNASNSGMCIPKIAPGLKFWESATATTTCNYASVSCTVVFEKGLFGGKECKENCECLDQNWIDQRTMLCKALGDCGPKINWVGDKGYSSGYNYTIKKI